MTEPADEADAEAALRALSAPRRRARPRLAAALRDAEALEVETAEGLLAVWRTGPGPAHLLVHGWEDDNALWGPYLDLAGRYGRAAVVLDLPGHGFSPAPFKDLQATGAALAAVASAAGPITGVLAHSFGCPATVQALAGGLQAEAVVLIASPLPRHPSRRLEGRLAELEDQALADRVLELLEARGSFDVLRAVEELRTPALFLHAADDEDCPADRAARIASVWPGAEFRLFEALGHRAIAQDAEVLLTAFCFLEGVDPGMFAGI